MIVEAPIRAWRICCPEAVGFHALSTNNGEADCFGFNRNPLRFRARWVGVGSIIAA